MYVMVLIRDGEICERGVVSYTTRKYDERRKCVAIILGWNCQKSRPTQKQ